MQARRWIGIDVGGANLKFADCDGWTHAEAFPLWKHPEKLSDRLRRILPIKHPNLAYALTMTGELADCFDDRAAGVVAIIDSVVEAIGCESLLRVYGLGGHWFRPGEGSARWNDIAAANWFAMGAYATRLLQESERGVLIDIGSTTTDVIALARGGVQTASRSDFDRLRTSELLYFGVGRTPLCAIAARLPFRGDMVPVMAEWFATTDDCRLVLGLVEESPSDVETADGKPRTVQHSIRRLARTIGLDHSMFGLEDAKRIARWVERELKQRLATAIGQVAPDADRWVISGHGSWLVPESISDGCPASKTFLCDAWSDQQARVGPAFALAVLATERFG
ncbi:MAG: hydantoinase/oxoprolinase family protein [Pirellulaceae bacterium]